MSAFNEYGRLSRVLLRPARYAFPPDRVLREWQALNFTAPPDLSKATQEYTAFEKLVAASGAQIEHLTDTDGLTLDAIYVRDAAIASPRGMILSRMGKPARHLEPQAQRRMFEVLGVPVAGEITEPGHVEGGDVVWFDAHTVAIGRGYRTNDAGIGQFKTLVGHDVNVIVVALPHHRGPDDVFHLMSIVSPVDRDLAVVYSPLMSVSFREWLIDRGIALVEVPREEFDAMGANVLAIAPRRCVMLNGAPATRAGLEAAGAQVLTYDGVEISLKGGGGPTCLTRPLGRE